jgi:uncharacterized membrane protein
MIFIYIIGNGVGFIGSYDKFIVCFENKYFDPIGSPLLKDKEAFAYGVLKFAERKNK